MIHRHLSLILAHQHKVGLKTLLLLIPDPRTSPLAKAVFPEPKVPD